MKIINIKPIFKILLLIICIGIDYSFLIYLNPNKINQLLILVFYLLIFTTFYLVIYLGLYYLKHLKYIHLDMVKERFIATFVSVLIIVFLALNSVGQLTWINFLLLILFGVFLLVYVSINRTKQ